MRGDVPNRDPGFRHRMHGSKKDASFQIIVLGSSGGPREDTITGLLVRAPQTEWRKSSMIAVDAGAHLASIVRVLEQEMPVNSEKIPPKDYSKVLDAGPFAGIRFPHISAKANALYIFRELLHSFLITHPHLDHLSGMGINTPALEYGREAKAIVALPATIEAIKSHIFNDSIWPNLSDEGHGVGFVTYRRLIEGGNPRLGYGESRGYVNVCDGLATKCWGVSHGKCNRRSHSTSHQRGDSFGFQGDGYNFPTRRLSRISDDHGYISAISQQHAQNAGAYPPAVPLGQATPGAATAIDRDHLFEPVCSSAFFIRNDVTGQELLIFGDIEPDSVSMSPRNVVVWEDAAPKIAKGSLKAIFIECSYDDSVRNEDLYGHLCPRHLIAELMVLAKRVMNVQANQAISDAESQKQVEQYQRHPSHNLKMKDPPTPTDLKRKRKRDLNGDASTTPEPHTPVFASIASPSAHPTKIPLPHVSPTSTQAQYAHSRRKTDHFGGDDHLSEARPSTPQTSRSQRSTQIPGDVPTQGVMAAAIPGHLGLSQPQKLPEPLKGLTVHIIHIKDTMSDGPSPGEIIARQLENLAMEAGLGCEFDITGCGESIWV